MSRIIEAYRELDNKRLTPKEARGRIKDVKERIADRDSSKTPSDSAFDIFNDYVDSLIKNFEEALAKRAEILGKVPEEEREKTADLMEMAESLILAVRDGDFPSREQIEVELDKKNS